MSRIYIHFDSKVAGDNLIESGWTDSGITADSVRHRIGGNPAEALNRLRGVFDLSGFKIRGAFGEDVKIETSTTLQGGDFSFKGIHIIVRTTGTQNGYLNFSGPFKHFQKLLELMVQPDFTTDWLDHVKKQPVEAWEADKKPTLVCRLAHRRTIGGKKK
jgi:hypothetical protein